MMNESQREGHPASEHFVIAQGRRLVHWITTAEKTIAVGLLVVILGITFAQVLARFLFNSPFSWSDELARYSYVWLTFIASAAVMSQRGHITVEVGDAKMPRRVRIGLNIIGMAVVVVASAMLMFGSVEFLEHRASGYSTGLGIPMALFYGVVAAGVVLIGLHALINILLMSSEWLLSDEDYSALETSRTATRPEEGL
ncbi:TRAP transporter small permease [Nesterenkonia haasae]|uniref:TRAP transporter small permease n=1 Tax=Nesterenkonia haasae TaxID=2587813 RepID=UPI001390B96C|nr:TRAP transporter small permease [Nesterenkonia haasae]NDK32489.1 TRAP transporter small permease [Nesterenkonia haasae]